MNRFFASCPKGLELLLSEELTSLGATTLKSTDAGVGFQADMSAAYRICLWSRLASRVFIELARFDADDGDALYEGAGQIPWADHMDSESSFCIDASLRASNITHSQFAALRVKDAIVDYFREREGKRPSVVKEEPEIRVNVHVRAGVAVVSLDLSGSAMHERGYRAGTGLAPLKENLAAAILTRLQWEKIAASGGGFIDPMCGSGTFAIEAAWVAYDIAPGLLRRHWGFTGWRGFERDLWKKILREAVDRKRAASERKVELLGFDSDPRIISRARENASNAGVGEQIKFAVRDLSDWEAASSKPAEAGLLVANPPYGERMGEAAALTETYATLGRVLRESFQGWKAGIFTGNPNLGKMMGIRSSKKYSFLNGAIPCELLVFDVNDASQVRAHAGHSLELASGAVTLSEGAVAFRNRVLKNFKHLSKWAKREEIECYRVYDADIPDYNVALDLYRDALVVQEYAPPREIPESSSDRRLQEILLVAPEVLGIDRASVFLKKRTRQRGTAQYKRQDREEDWREVEENGHRFLVNLSNYLDTGLFLDHRITRKMIELDAKGKSFLNLFAYTGSASVYAAAGGASRTLTVDLSNTYLEWASRNMELNGFTGDNHNFYQADCRLWLKSAREKFDLIFIDPPTFSNSKKLREPFQVQQDYLYLLEHAARILTPNGKIYFSNNFRQFKMDEVVVGELGLKVRDLSRLTIPADFARNPRIHRCWTLEFAAAVGKVVGDDAHGYDHKEKPKKITHR